MITFPPITDGEGNQISATTELRYPRSYSCNCVRIKQNLTNSDSPIWIEVNQNLITAADAGDYFVTVIL